MQQLSLMPERACAKKEFNILLPSPKCEIPSNFVGPNSGSRWDQFAAGSWFFAELVQMGFGDKGATRYGLKMENDLPRSGNVSREEMDTWISDDSRVLPDTYKHTNPNL